MSLVIGQLDEEFLNVAQRKWRGDGGSRSCVGSIVTLRLTEGQEIAAREPFFRCLLGQADGSEFLREGF
jgi:hypothetical protein